MEHIGSVHSIPCERISPFAGQPRTHFNGQKMDELLASIKEVGQRVPAIVKPLPDGGRYAYELVDGERRWRVCAKLGIPLKAWVKTETMDTKQQFLESVIANFGREDHSELEILQAIIKVKGDFDLTLEQTAAYFGRSVGWVQQYLSLRKLEPKVLEMLSPEFPEGQRLTFSHALLLTSLKPELQVNIAQTVTQQGLKLKEAKYLVERHMGSGNQRTQQLSPRKEYEKFLNFLQRTMVDLELLLKQPKKYFDDMFQYRVPEDLTRMSGMVDRAIENLTAIKETLDRIRKGSKKVVGGN